MGTADLPHALPLLRELLLFCAIAGVLIPLVRRLHVSQVLAFLVAGAVIGPYGLASVSSHGTLVEPFTITDLAGTRAIAEFGVVFLLFTLGLELSIPQLWSMRRWVFGLGTAQILATAVVIGVIARSFGNSNTAATVLGFALALSSTAIVVQLLAERRELGSAMGRTTFGVLLMQDLMVVPLLVLVDNVGAGADERIVEALFRALAKGAAAVSVILLVGARFVQPLFHHVSTRHQPDAFMAVTLLVTLGTATITWAAGLSLALGAFLAGLLLSETAYRHQIEVTIQPFKGLLIGLFFLAVGMGIDLRELADEPLWIPLSVLGLFAIKSLLAAIAMRLFGTTWAAAVEGGCLLGQGGEFAFIVVGIALVKGLLAPSVGQFMLIVVGFSMLMAPLVAKFGRLCAERLSPGVGASAPAELPSAAGRVVIAGYGRVGQLVGEVLDRERIPYLALDRNAHRVAMLRATGAPVYFADVEHPDLFAGALGDEAAAIVITLDGAGVAKTVAYRLRQRYPRLTIIARARDEAHANALRELDVERVVPETLEAALQLSVHVLEALGYPDDAAHKLVQAVRETRLADQRSLPR